MAANDKYHDDLVLIPRGTLAGNVTGSGNIEARSGLGKMTDYMLKRESAATGIEVPATGEVKGAMRVIKPTIPETVNKAEPLTRDQMRARSRANAEVQNKIGKEKRTDGPRWSKDANYDADIPSELNFKKGGKVKVSKASSRADGIAQRGKTKGRYL